MASGRKMYVVKKCYSRWDKMRSEVIRKHFLFKSVLTSHIFSNPRKIKKAPAEMKMIESALTSHKIKDFPDKWLIGGW